MNSPKIFFLKIQWKLLEGSIQSIQRARPHLYLWSVYTLIFTFLLQFLKKKMGKIIFLSPKYLMFWFLLYFLSHNFLQKKEEKFLKRRQRYRPECFRRFKPKTMQTPPSGWYPETDPSLRGIWKADIRSARKLDRARMLYPDSLVKKYNLFEQEWW